MNVDKKKKNKKRVKLNPDERECLKCRKPIKKPDWLCGSCRSNNNDIRSVRLPAFHFSGNDTVSSEDLED